VPRARHELDVIYTAPELGIGFCVTLKRGPSVRGAQPPTFRMSKINEELRNEASGYVEFLDEVEKSYLQRNAAKSQWADSQDTDEDDPERSS